MGSHSSEFNGQNWLIAPATPLLPGPSLEQSWLLTLTGIYALPVSGGKSIGENWRLAQVHLLPDFVTPLNFALSLYGIPQPTPTGPRPLLPVFLLDPQGAPYVNVAGVFSGREGAGLGCNVLSWDMGSSPGVDDEGNPLAWVFEGVSALIETRNLDDVHRISYHFTFRGHIQFFEGGLGDSRPGALSHGLDAGKEDG